VYYLRLLLDDKPQLHETVKAGVPDSCALASNKDIPSVTPTPRKKKNDDDSRKKNNSYESVVTALNSLADPEGKKGRWRYLFGRMRERKRRKKKEKVEKKREKFEQSKERRRNMR